MSLFGKKKSTEEAPGSDLGTRVKWFNGFIDATADARKSSEKDRNFYDGIQWDQEEKDDLDDRGQPCITINRIASKTNYVLGQEIATRVDPHAYPRTPGHDDEADAITDALRYVADEQDFAELSSDVFGDIGIEGYGGCVIETEDLPNGDRDVKLRYAPWDRIWFDPHSRAHDFSDAQYMGIVNWWDVEQLLKTKYAETAEQRKIIEESRASPGEGTADTTDDKPRWYDSSRNRIQVVECYWKEGNQWWSAVYCLAGDLIKPKALLLKDDRGRSFCPMLIESGMVMRNQKNARYGFVRNMISPQEEINKRRSKALHLISVRQVMYEEDAIEDIDGFQTQLARPDGALKVQQGAVQEQRVQILDNLQLAQGQAQLLQDAKAEIDQTGPDAALVASDQRQMSGRLFLARQQAGRMELGRIFDNFRFWRIRVFKTIWYFVRLFWN
jgi:hypothetical protein